MLLTLMGLLMCSQARAEVRASVDRNEVTTQDQVVLTVELDGASSDEPTLPPLNDFEVYSRGTTQQIQIINGQTSRSLAFTYILVPKRTGTFEIGAITADIDGHTEASQPFSIRVIANDKQPQSSGDLFATASVSKSSPYRSEQIIYTLRLFTRVRIAEASVEVPNFDGFMVEELGEQKSYESVVRGQTYRVNEFRRALFPQETGQLPIGPAAFTVEAVERRSDGFGGFGGFLGRLQTRSRVIRAAPIELNVRPLPTPPQAFSGLVGQFHINAQLSKSRLKVGESASLTVTVSGVGNAQMIPEPAIDGLEAFKSYDDKPESKIERSGAAIAGQRVFRKALVPIQAGTVTLPPITLSYFDPNTGNYRTAKSQAFPIQVDPSDGKEELKLTEFATPLSGKVAVTMLGDDILGQHTTLDALISQDLAQRDLPRWGGLTIGPILLFAGLSFLRRRVEQDAVDGAAKRRRHALRNALRNLRELKKIHQKSGNKEAAIFASRLLREFLGAELAVEGLALTPRDAALRLESEGIHSDCITQVQELLSACDAAQYGHDHAGILEHSIADNSMRTLMQRIDREVRASAGSRLS
ncbi:MAG: BatD family protein [Myxococcota bacterium]